MFGIVRRLKRWWRIRTITNVRNGLIRYGDPNDPDTQERIEALGRLIEDVRRGVKE